MNLDEKTHDLFFNNISKRKYCTHIINSPQVLSKDKSK